MKKIKKLIMNMLLNAVESANKTNMIVNNKIKEKGGDETSLLKEAYCKEIESEDDARIMFELQVANTTYAFAVIVDKKSLMIKDNYDFYFVLINNITYNNDNFELLDDDIYSLSLAMLGSKISIVERDKLKFRIQNEFIMNYGIFNNPELYKKVLAFNFIKAIGLSNETSRELAKTLYKKQG